jgi:hypothetical protein
MTSKMGDYISHNNNNNGNSNNDEEGTTQRNSDLLRPRSFHRRYWLVLVTCAVAMLESVALRQSVQLHQQQHEQQRGFSSPGSATIAADPTATVPSATAIGTGATTGAGEIEGGRRTSHATTRHYRRDRVLSVRPQQRQQQQRHYRARVGRRRPRCRTSSSSIRPPMVQCYQQHPSPAVVLASRTRTWLLGPIPTAHRWRTGTTCTLFSYRRTCNAQRAVMPMQLSLSSLYMPPSTRLCRMLSSWPWPPSGTTSRSSTYPNQPMKAFIAPC